MKKGRKRSAGVAGNALDYQKAAVCTDVYQPAVANYPAAAENGGRAGGNSGVAIAPGSGTGTFIFALDVRLHAADRVAW